MNILRNPVIAGMIVVLVILVAAFVGNHILVQQNLEKSSTYLSYANELKALAQELSLIHI